MAIAGLSARRLRASDIFPACYRVYFGEEAGCIVVLLCGGDKSSQEQDIQATKAYWKEYRNRG